MASAEKRQLEIEAKLNDFVSKNLSTIQRSIGKFARSALTRFKSLAKSVFSVRTAVLGLVGAWAAFRGGRASLDVLGQVDAMDKLGDSVGASVGQMITLQTAFELAGVESEKFRLIIASLGRAQGQAVDKGNALMVEGFARLGISIEQLRAADPAQLFDSIAGGLERYTTAQEKSAALARFFPDNFQKLFSALGQGQEQFRKLIGLAQQFTGTVTEAGAAAAVRFGDAVTLLRTALQSIGRDTLINLAERFAPVVERIAVFIAENRDTIANGLAQIVQAVAKFFAAVGVVVLQGLAFLTEKGADLLEFLAEIPIIGDALREKLGAIFDIPKLSDDARRIRDEASGVADELRKLEAEQNRLRSFQVENDPTGKRLEMVGQQVDELKRKLRELGEAFSAAGGTGDLTGNALQASSLRQMSEMLQKLADFNNLPGLPAGLGGVLRDLILGKDGPQELQQTIDDFFRGFGDQIEVIRQKWSDFAETGRNAANQLVDRGLDGIVNAFADIVTRTKSAKEALKDFARSLLADLARIIARLLIVRAVSSIFDGSTTTLETGGVVQGQMGKPVKLESFESGGIARGPTLALFGEGRASKGEAFVPLPDGRNIPVMLRGGGGTNITFNISAMDGRDVQRMLIEQRDTIGGIIRNQAQTVGMRQVLQRATA